LWANPKPIKMTRRASIAIPEPCHENWNDMTAAEKGRFCGSCQKHVQDFTRSSDREILQKFKVEKNICGRFLDSQLDRELVYPKEKTPIWVAVASGVMSFIAIGSHTVNAQTQPKTVLVSKTSVRKVVKPATAEIELIGVVYNDMAEPIDSALVSVKEYNKSVVTDKYGRFSIIVKPNSTVIFSKEQHKSQELSFDGNRGHLTIYLPLQRVYKQRTESVTVGGAMATGIMMQRRSLAGRLLVNIANLFRSKNNKHF
jgi:hypothetical protein